MSHSLNFHSKMHGQFWSFDMAKDGSELYYKSYILKLQHLDRDLNLPQAKEEQHDGSYLESKVACKMCEHQSMAQSRKDHPMILSPHAIAHGSTLQKEHCYRNSFTQSDRHLDPTRRNLSRPICQSLFISPAAQKTIVLRPPPMVGSKPAYSIF